MTTTELKQYIDKVLGNSIRCLLPSYWWKRLFSLTLEKVDEKLDATNIKTINGESIVGEGNLKVGVTTVGSIDELNALEAEVGDVATVGEESIMLVSAGDLPKVDDPNELLEKWDSLTRIYKVEFGEPVTENGLQATVYLNGKKPYAYDSIVIWSSEGKFACGYGSADGVINITIEQVNKKLQESDYRFVHCSTTDFIDRAFKLHAYSASANAYIKGETWTRLLKEGDEESGVELRDLYIYENYDGTLTELTDEQKAWNLETSELVKQGKAIVRVTLGGSTYILEASFIEDNGYLFSYTQASPSGVAAIYVSVTEDGLARITDAYSPFDSELSETSENAVQNKVIKAYVDAEVAKKQNTLISGTNIKTINGNSILGEGNIVVGVDTSNLATKEEVTNLQNEVIANEEVSAAAFNEINDRINAISENVSGTTVTKGEFETTVTTLNESIATKADATSTSEAITGLQTSVSELNTSLGNYATTEALNTEIINITNEIITNEEITAAAFADLNTRLLEVVSRLDALENN